MMQFSGGGGGFAQSYADQAASDRDRGAAARDSAAAASDQAGADADQRASDADQASSDRDLSSGGPATAAERRDHHESQSQRLNATAQREASTVSRETSQSERTLSARERSETSALRDHLAAERDRAAALRETAARRDENALMARDPGNASLRAVVASNVRMRDESAADRRRATADRTRADEDRVAAAAANQAQDNATGTQPGNDSRVLDQQSGYAALQAEIDRSRRSDDSFVLAYVGTHGLTDREGEHPGGASITSVARLLGQSLHRDDLIVRGDGEGLMCGLVGAEPESAARRANEIRTALRRADLPDAPGVGFALLEASDTLDSLITRAAADMKLDHRHQSRPKGN